MSFPGSGKENSLSHKIFLIIDSYFAEIEKQRKSYFRQLDLIEMALCWACMYFRISEFSDQIVPFLLQRKICIEIV